MKDIDDELNVIPKIIDSFDKFLSEMKLKLRKEETTKRITRRKQKDVNLDIYIKDRSYYGQINKTY